jgi:2-dehydro-3-deoxyphosphogluconate aldolase/(4S)-4-hydroxy-2-oxoglutarate aldolase
MNTVLEELGKTGIVPVIKIDDAGKAVPLARALIAGGIPCAEVTFRTDQCEDALRRINAEVPEILLGAGTVLNTAQVDRALAAGAKFIVSPGFNPRVVARCIDRGIPVIPGCSNPSDIERALEADIDVIKFFPAELTGGPAYMKALSGPYRSLKFIPTGGINVENIAKYSAYEKTLACGVTWIVSSALIEAGDFDAISRLCREAVLAMLGFTVAHLGINASAKYEAETTAKFFQNLFGFAPRETAKSFFAGEKIEIMNAAGRGAHGHIGLGTWSVPKAKHYLERLGMTFDEAGAVRTPDGEPVLIYMNETVLGFALHLVKRTS